PFWQPPTSPSHHPRSGTPSASRGDSRRVSSSGVSLRGVLGLPGGPVGQLAGGGSCPRPPSRRLPRLPAEARPQPSPRAPAATGSRDGLLNPPLVTRQSGGEPGPAAGHPPRRVPAGETSAARVSGRPPPARQGRRHDVPLPDHARHPRSAAAGGEV